MTIEPKSEPRNGKLSISKVHGDESYVSLVITDDNSGIDFCEVEIDFAAFAQALLGLAGRPARIITRALDLVGATRELKTIEVVVSSALISDRAKYRAIATAAIAEHEKDGWIGRVDDAMNHHRIVERIDSDTNIMRVGFTRYVDGAGFPIQLRD